MAELVEAFEVHMLTKARAGGCTLGTAKAYVRDVRALSAFLTSGSPGHPPTSLHVLESADFVRWIGSLKPVWRRGATDRAPRPSPNTWKRRKVSVSQFVSFCHTLPSPPWTHDPLANVGRAGVATPERPCFTRAESELLMAAPLLARKTRTRRRWAKCGGKDPGTLVRDTLLVQLPFLAGLRVFEVASLRVEDCYLDAREEPQPSSSLEDVAVVSPFLRLVHTKRSKFRMVPVPSRLADTLRAYALFELRPGPWLFPGQEGHLAVSRVSTIFREHAELANLRIRAPHAARRCYATGLIRNEQDAAEAQALRLGTDVVVAVSGAFVTGLKAARRLLGHGSDEETEKYLSVEIEQGRFDALRAERTFGVAPEGA